MHDVEKKESRAEKKEETTGRKLKLQVRSFVTAPAGDEQASWSSNCPVR